MDKALKQFSKMSGEEVRRGLFIVRQLKDLDLDLESPLVKEIYNNAFEASEILSKKELIAMIEDLVDLQGPRLFR